MICNLQQNPLRRPIIANWLPALLRQGCMFIIHLNGDLGEERWLLDEEWTVMVTVFNILFQFPIYLVSLRLRLVILLVIIHYPSDDI